MCGIIGFNWPDKKLTKKALKKINHRGPDNSGIFSNKDISLGHNRLSILDLSKSGNQPMSNEDNSLQIIFNGEIYNHKELKKSLKSKHKFKSNTDTEVLLHLYEERGPEMLEELQGMFAFCIYDSKKRQLFIARDRVGIKPLYYYNKDKNFIFGSEIKGMLEIKKIKREINLNALSNFLTFRANTSQESLIKGIHKLPPGHHLIYNIKNNKLNINQYWSLNHNPTKKSKKYYETKIKQLLNDSVKSRLMSDVPYGAYLSGGVDSGAIVSLMSKNSKQPIKTFSVGFETDVHSETEEAKFLAKKLKTDHHELKITKDSIKNLPEIVYQSDEPNADPTIIPIYFLAKHNKKYCTVILTGEGADELFAGYPQYKFMKIRNTILNKFPRSIRKVFPLIIKNSPNKFLNKIFAYSSALGEKGIGRLSNFLESNNHSEQYLNQVAIFNESEQRRLLKNKISLYKKYESYFSNPKTIITNSSKLDFQNPMVEGLLMKIDKNTMASSVEGRVPFLDHRLIELAAQIPENMKLRGFTKDKHILRQAVKGLVPKETLSRRKHHFFVPIDSWMEKELSSLMGKFLSHQYIKKQNIFNYNYIAEIRNGFKKSKLYYARQLWCLIIFQIWYKQYIENEKVKI